MSDKKAESMVVHLRLVQAMMLARNAMLKRVQDNKEHLAADLKKFRRAKEHVEEAIELVEGTYWYPDEVQVDLPF